MLTALLTELRESRSEANHHQEEIRQNFNAIAVQFNAMDARLVRMEEVTAGIIRKNNLMLQGYETRLSDFCNSRNESHEVRKKKDM